MNDVELGSSNIFEIREKFKDPVFGGKQLETISIFSSFEVSELQRLYQLGEIKSFNPKSNIIVEGGDSRGIYLVLHGTVSIYKNDVANNTMIRLTYVEAGSYFGEMSLFDSSPRSATVVAESVCHLFYLDMLAFDGFLDKSGDQLKVRLYKKCAEEMASRFRLQNNDYIEAQNLLRVHALERKKKPEEKEE